MKSKLSTAKKSKTTTFSRVFHPQKIANFLGKSKLNFWTKNEDLEQCAFNQKKIEFLSGLFEQAKRPVGEESMTPRLTGSKMPQVAAAFGGHAP